MFCLTAKNSALLVTPPAANAPRETTSIAKRAIVKNFFQFWRDQALMQLVVAQRVVVNDIFPTSILNVVSNVIKTV